MRYFQNFNGKLSGSMIVKFEIYGSKNLHPVSSENFKISIQKPFFLKTGFFQSISSGINAFFSFKIERVTR